MPEKALLVVDLVNDFMPRDFYPKAKLSVKPLKEIFEFIREGIALARKYELPLIFLCDEHKKGDEEFELYGEHCVTSSQT